MHTEMWSESLKARGRLKDLSIDGRIRSLKKWGDKLCGLDSSGSG
jgi:hypothetical protein